MIVSSSHTNQKQRQYLLNLKRKKQLEATLKARSDLSVAFRYWQMYGRDTRIMWFHKRIAEALEKVQRREIKKLIIQMPTQHGKSSFCSIVFPAWCFGKKDEQIGIVGYNSTLASGFNRAIRRLMLKPQYMATFPDVNLPSSRIHGTPKSDEHAKTSSKIEFYNSSSVLHTLGYGGSLGGQHLTITILDDPYKHPKDADSFAYSNYIWQVFTQVVEERLHDDGVIVMPFSRWRNNDLIGRVLERDGRIEDGGEWTVITFRSLREIGDSDPLDPRPIGGVLWSKVRTEREVKKIEENEPRQFDGLHQQRPSKEGGSIVKKEWFSYYNPELLDYKKRFICDFYLDTALTSEKDLEKSQGNPSKSGILVYAAINGRMYLVDYIEGYWSFPDLIDKCNMVQDKYGMAQSVLNIENRANGKSLYEYLKKTAPDLNLNLDNVSIGKAQRLMMQQERLMTGKVLLPLNASWIENWLHNVCIHPQGQTEQGDTLSGSMKMMFDENQRPTQWYDQSHNPHGYERFAETM